MPEKVEKKLREQGKKKGFVKKKLDDYIYGAMRKMGWPFPKGKKKKRHKEVARPGK